MKAFLAAVVAIVVIAIGADLALERVGLSTAEVYTTDNVRLDE